MLLAEGVWWRPRRRARRARATVRVWAAQPGARTVVVKRDGLGGGDGGGRRHSPFVAIYDRERLDAQLQSSLNRLRVRVEGFAFLPRNSESAVPLQIVD
jgi:hypothetical protein